MRFLNKQFLNKQGWFAIDTILALTIIFIAISAIYSSNYIDLHLKAKNAEFMQAVEQMESHLEILLGKSCWEHLDGEQEQISDEISCSYELSETEDGTCQLTVEFYTNLGEHTYIIEKFFEDGSCGD